ncbi:uncharacterized protein L969DRAFT_15596 [Mixia osmundae IAM 14324]|uniref:Uncharacterized protein n=1 Tax=Mixia osmundae (strain CBS 9802 / IAM 14324 / JCM 22182 / KY 12970) TaxID=764103 RepID=G7DYL1_MIXOS|nr:uncharacterized protein L969DRAFT_15596 [Mixia osmundae IAM 14324]KEI41570.1 hypothetical protein L969DRAFT_15596 [Mixia osmundae IAM 14324]GAA95671.1 hypothetical protein E5Q_02328 [Mixia osmundae IAM 14324]
MHEADAIMDGWRKRYVSSAASRPELATIDSFSDDSDSSAGLRISSEDFPMPAYDTHTEVTMDHLCGETIIRREQAPWAAQLSQANLDQVSNTDKQSTRSVIKSLLTRSSLDSSSTSDDGCAPVEFILPSSKAAIKTKRPSLLARTKSILLKSAANERRYKGKRVSFSSDSKPPSLVTDSSSNSSEDSYESSYDDHTPPSPEVARLCAKFDAFTAAEEARMHDVLVRRILTPPAYKTAFVRD